MTNTEAIQWLQLDIDMMKFDPSTGEEAYLNDDAKKTLEALDMAISALKKLIPERPKRIITNKEVAGNFQMVCPSCGWLMFERVTTKDSSEAVVYRTHNFCQSCGQRIDWGES